MSAPTSSRFSLVELRRAVEALGEGGAARIAHRAGLEVECVTRALRGRHPGVLEGQRLSEAARVELLRSQRHH